MGFFAPKTIVLAFFVAILQQSSAGIIHQNAAFGQQIIQPVDFSQGYKQVKVAQSFTPITPNQLKCNPGFTLVKDEQEKYHCVAAVSSQNSNVNAGQTYLSFSQQNVNNNKGCSAGYERIVDINGKVECLFQSSSQQVETTQSSQNNVVSVNNIGSCGMGFQNINVNGFSQCVDVARLRIDNGNFVISNSNPLTCNFNCNQGFTLVGQPQISYQVNQWVGNAPTCIQMPFNSIRHGEVECLDGVTYTFSCIKGYKLFGNERIQLVNNRLDGQYPVCIPEADLILENGNVRVEIISQGYNLVYKCNANYDLVGVSEVISFEGQKVTNKPTCVPVLQCPILHIDNGFVETNKQSNMAIFGCCDGFQLIGNTQAFCVNGRWSNELPRCAPLCENIKLNNGKAFVAPNTSVAVFKCDPNFQLIGSQQSTCIDGKWSEETPFCIPFCPEIIVPNGVIRTDERRTKFQISCNQNYTLKGNSELSCNFGQWSHPFPICVGECQSLHLNEGFVTFSKDRSVVKFTCKSGFALIGKKESRCVGGQWSSALPTCVPVCKSVNTITAATSNMAVYNCNTGVTLVG